MYVVLQVIQKLRDNNIYPTSLELLRVNLAATVFSPEVQDILQQFKDDVKHALGLKNTDPLSTYMNHFWELLQLNNSVSTVLHYIYYSLFINMCICMIFTEGSYQMDTYLRTRHCRLG